MDKKNKMNTLQILRAIAFFEIFFGHCGIAFFTGAFGVSIFIVLSGFCMAVNYLPKAETLTRSPLDNVKSAIFKIRKLYGLHLLMLVCAFLLARMPTSPDAVKRMVMDLLLVQSLSPYAADYFSYNGVSWYLSMYLFLSMAAPYVILLLSRMKEKRQVMTALAAALAIMAAVGVYVSRTQLPIGDNFAFWLTYISPFYRILEFFSGAVFGWLYCNQDSKEKCSTAVMTFTELLTAALFVGVICIFHKLETKGGYDGLCYTALFTPVSILLVMVFAKSRGLLLKLLDNPFLLWLGNLSGYTFLIHQVVIRWLRTVLDGFYMGNHETAVITLGSLLITVCAAEGFQRIQGNVRKIKR